MANVQIPNLPQAINLTGTEQLEIVQPPGSGGTSKWTTTGDVANLVNAPVLAGEFVLLAPEPILTQSRTLTGSANVTLTDAGPQSTVTLDLSATGVGAGTYGSATQVAQVTFDANGRATAAVDVPISVAAASIVVGTTAVSGGATTRVLFDNAGVLGEYAQVPIANGGTNASSVTALNYWRTNAGATAMEQRTPAQLIEDTGASTSVPTLAALKALTTRPALVTMDGISSAGDGNAGPFWWDAGSSATPNDLDVIEPTAGPSGRYMRLLERILANSVEVSTSGLAEALTITQALTGSQSLGYWNSISISSDDVPVEFSADFYVEHHYGGASARGSRAGVVGWVIQDSANTGVGFTYAVGVEGIAQSNSGDGGTGLTASTAKGAYIASNMIARNDAQHVYQVSGEELDYMTKVGSSHYYGSALQLANFAAVQATALDAAVVIYSGGEIDASGGGGPWGPGVGFKFGIAFGELGDNGLVPISADGTLLGGYVETLSEIPIAYGIDLRLFTTSGADIIGKSFKIDTAGKGIFAGATDRDNAMDIGADTGVNVVRLNGGSGSSNGSLVAFSASGTAFSNIGFPSAIFGGAFDAALGISGFSGLKFYTNNTLAMSVDTAQALVLAASPKVPGGSTPLLTTVAGVTSGAGSDVGTLTNAPAAGNPTKWMSIDDNGTTRYFPTW